MFDFFDGVRSAERDASTTDTVSTFIGVQGSGFRVKGLGFRVQGQGFRVQSSGFRVRVQGPGLRM
jgi:hypothetical protein